VRDSLTPASASAAVPGAQAGEAHAREAGATLRVVVVDDERPARHFLLGLLRGAPDVEVVGEAADGHEAVALIERTRPDLAFLDLQMPELDGLGVVRALERAIRRDGLPLVAFVTAYDAYAVRAFEVHAVDYLLKPVDGPRLRRTLERAHERLDRADMRESAAAALRRAALEVEAARDEGLEDDAEAAGGDAAGGAPLGAQLGASSGDPSAGRPAPGARAPRRRWSASRCASATTWCSCPWRTSSPWSPTASCCTSPPPGASGTPWPTASRTSRRGSRRGSSCGCRAARWRASTPSPASARCRAAPTWSRSPTGRSSR
jgi:CheY-like chemotaxis protein